MRPICIVTGASHGIGAATAKLFAAEGYDICISYLSDDAAAGAVVAACEAHGARAIAVRGNVGKRDDVLELFAQCDARLGRVSCLINNAGIIGKSGRLVDLEPEALERTFQINVFGLTYCIQEATKRMSTKAGVAGLTIINMSSLSA